MLSSALARTIRHILHLPPGRGCLHVVHPRHGPVDTDTAVASRRGARRQRRQEGEADATVLDEYRGPVDARVLQSLASLRSLLLFPGNQIYLFIN